MLLERALEASRIDPQIHVRYRLKAMFACPACHAVLNRAIAADGILWMCPACNGRAVNVALLRRRINREHFNRIWQTIWEGDVRTDRKCPACEKPMIEVPVRPPPDPLVLDACKACQFVWFDASELEKIPAPPPQPSAEEAFHKLPLEARQIIAEHKVREMGEQARREEAARSVTSNPWLDVVDVIFTLPDF